MKNVNTSAKRLEGELFYDYCCRRELERHRLAILKLGLVAYSSRTPYVKPYNRRKSMSKADKKAFKKARRAYKFSAQAKV